MKPASKMLVLLLLAALIPSANAQMLPWTVPNSAAPGPAGCHEHGPKPAAPQPVSYRCCQVGHKAAILQASWTPPSSSGHSLSFSSPAIEVKLAAVAGLIDDFESLSASVSPPGAVPLRI
jgi:hypothetical protein